MSQNLESIAVSGLQKVYFREWDNAQESVDSLEENPLVGAMKKLCDIISDSMCVMSLSDEETGVNNFGKDVEALGEVLGSLAMIGLSHGFKSAARSALIVAASEQENSPGLPILNGFSIDPETSSNFPFVVNLEPPTNLVNEDGNLEAKHEATARALLANDQIPQQLADVLPCADESEVYWGR
tara:strand:- start:390 stop:938 length:549 start_codon:yes stop_codon:yes gene_type:complete